MLNWLKIVNLALIESADVEFGDNFHVFTGETGAGKSILLGTIALLLGERADKGLIRTGCDRCEISAGIQLDFNRFPDVAVRLEEAGIAVEKPVSEIQLRRVITRTQNRNFINDTPVTIQTLKAIGELLVDIHGANEHQSLLSRSRQLEILDRFADIEKEKKACGEAFSALQKLKKERDELLHSLPSPSEAAQLELLVEEIEKVAPVPGEDESVNAKFQVAANAQNVLELAGRSLSLLGDSENSIEEQLAAVFRNLSEMERFDERGCETLLTQCRLLTEGVSDLAAAIEHYAGAVELDEETFAALETRLSALQTLKRRYGPTLEQVLETLDLNRKRLEHFHHSAELRAELDCREQELQERLEEAAACLSLARQRKAKQLCSATEAMLKQLGFSNCQFTATFTKQPSGANGCDLLDFIFSANPGEEPQPLRHIASSGELSRVMLALKTVLADADSVPVVIFDEVDVNIGGETARCVGNALAELAQKRQILAISHLAQVAARADRHYAVSKETHDGRTCTHIVELNQHQRIKELARMLGGGAAAERHAKDLLPR